MDYQIIEGDCRTVLADFRGQVDLIVTSPPYDNLRNYGGHGFDFEGVADACASALTEGGVLVWVVGDATLNGSETGTSFRQALYFMEQGLRLHDTMIYHKALPRYIKNEPRYANAFEYMFVLSKGKPKTFNPIIDSPNKHAGTVFKRNPQVRESDGLVPERKHYGTLLRTATFSKRSNVWRMATGGRHTAPDFVRAKEHPAIFPYQLASDHIRSWSNPGDLVLDPMAGSGTTVRAAVDLGRQAVGIDIHAEYCQLMRERLSVQSFTEG